MCTLAIISTVYDQNFHYLGVFGPAVFYLYHNAHAYFHVLENPFRVFAAIIVFFLFAWPPECQNRSEARDPRPSRCRPP